MSAGIDEILTCSNPLEVMPLISRQDVEAVLLDLSMPQMRGEDLLKRITEAYPEVPVIIVTASDDLETAVRCMKCGAFDYMVKAVEPNRLVSGIRRAIDMRRLRRKYSSLKNNLLSDEIAEPALFSQIITVNRKMQAAFRFIEAVAGSSETILITGETGTGKELFAEAVHRASGRCGELIKVNTAGLDETMFADTLFGHSRGAYTGADKPRKGLVQQAEEGTLFLDENQRLERTEPDKTASPA